MEDEKIAMESQVQCYDCSSRKLQLISLIRDDEGSILRLLCLSCGRQLFCAVDGTITVELE